MSVQLIIKNAGGVQYLHNLQLTASEIGLYNRLAVLLYVLDKASSENVGQEGHPS